MLLLVAPHHRTDTQPSFQPAPFPGFAGRQQSADVRARVQFQDPVLSVDPLCCSPKATPPFVLLPPTAGSAPLSQMNTPQYSSQAVVSSTLPQHKEQREREHRKELSFPPAPQLWEKNHSQDRSGLLNHCSCPGCLCLASAQGQLSIKSLEDLATTLHRVSQVRAALFRALQVGHTRLVL